MRRKYTEVLYKYRSLNDYGKISDIILNNRLYASDLKSLNDPVETHYYFAKGEIDENVIDLLKSWKYQYRICSLSRRKDSELMWSHYADGQRGIIIGVKIDKEKYEIVKDMSYTGYPDIISPPEDYSDTAIDIMSHKTPDWEYENEVRVFVPKCIHDCSTQYFVDVKIEEIIVGRAIGQREFSLLEKMVKKMNPKIPINMAADYMGQSHIDRD